MTHNIFSPHKKEQLEKISKSISHIRNKLLITTSTLTPNNYLPEMEKFFNSDKYNPVYTYNLSKNLDFKTEIESLLEEVKGLQLPVDIKNYFIDILIDLIKLNNTKRSIGTNDFSSKANELFNWKKEQLENVMLVTPKVKFILSSDHILYSAEKIKNAFVKTLSEYKITSMPVRIDNFSTHIISITSKEIKIGVDVKRYKCNVERLIVHEIESHAIQEINIRSNTNKISNLMKYSQRHLYAEGLAVYNEILSRKITPDAFDLYFNRLRAVTLIDKSFRDIFEILTKHIPPKKAYVITYRVKRGLKYTKEPGGFPKDASYLLGFHEIMSLINKGFDKNDLYITKSPILTSLLKKYDLLESSPLLIPKMYR